MRISSSPRVLVGIMHCEAWRFWDLSCATLFWGSRRDCCVKDGQRATVGIWILALAVARGDDHSTLTGCLFFAWWLYKVAWEPDVEQAQNQVAKMDQDGSVCKTGSSLPDPTPRSTKRATVR